LLLCWYLFAALVVALERTFVDVEDRYLFHCYSKKTLFYSILLPVPFHYFLVSFACRLPPCCSLNLLHCHACPAVYSIPLFFLCVQAPRAAYCHYPFCAGCAAVLCRCCACSLPTARTFRSPLKDFCLATAAPAGVRSCLAADSAAGAYAPSCCYPSAYWLPSLLLHYLQRRERLGGGGGSALPEQHAVLPATTAAPSLPLLLC